MAECETTESPLTQRTEVVGFAPDSSPSVRTCDFIAQPSVPIAAHCYLNVQLLDFEGANSHRFFLHAALPHTNPLRKS